MKKQKLLVIASFPPKGMTHDKAVVGVASYTKNTLTSIKRAGQNTDITVLAEELPGSEKTYKDRGISVKRIWKRDSLMTFPKLLKEIIVNQKDTSNILIEFEVSMFGNMFKVIPLPFFNFFLRLIGKKITLVSHQVISDIKEFEGHINLEKESYKADLINFMIKVFYLLIIKSVSKVIVFDEALRKMLSSFGDEDKIVVIPHGVESFNNLPTKKDARETLGISQNEFVLFSFGFLAWYKGTDWLVEAFKDLKKIGQKNKGKQVSLIIGGGPNPNHKDKEYYQKYVSRIEKECKRNGITITGFIPEEKIPLYFKACDLVILPYRTFMSASGPLSLAYSFNKPVLVSEKISKIFETNDIKETIEETKVNKDNLMFNLNEELLQRIKKVLGSERTIKKIANISSQMRIKRTWDNIGKSYYNEIFYTQL